MCTQNKYKNGVGDGKCRVQRVEFTVARLPDSCPTLVGSVCLSTLQSNHKVQMTSQPPHPPA